MTKKEFEVLQWEIITYERKWSVLTDTEEEARKKAANGDGVLLSQNLLDSHVISVQEVRKV